jgi:hypothetical protein
VRVLTCRFTGAAGGAREGGIFEALTHGWGARDGAGASCRAALVPILQISGVLPHVAGAVQPGGSMPMPAPRFFPKAVLESALVGQAPGGRRGGLRGRPRRSLSM